MVVSLHTGTYIWLMILMIICRVWLILDFKQVVIRSLTSSCDFEAAMQMKMSILTALFFVRHQGGTEAMDDFFTFAKKYIE